jgi:hypothetical protein
VELGTGRGQAVGELIQPGGRDSYRRVGLQRRGERRLDADVQLLLAECEPDAPAPSQCLGLLQLPQAD